VIRNQTRIGGPVAEKIFRGENQAATQRGRKKGVVAGKKKNEGGRINFRQPRVEVEKGGSSVFGRRRQRVENLLWPSQKK